MAPTEEEIIVQMLDLEEQQTGFEKMIAAKEPCLHPGTWPCSSN